jgi:hypothetical protein
MSLACVMLWVWGRQEETSMSDDKNIIDFERRAAL